MTRALYLVALSTALASPAFADAPVLTPYALVQAWGTIMDQDQNPQADPAGYGDPEADPGVSIRRARLGLSGHYKVIDYRVAFGMSSPADIYFQPQPLIGVVDAYAGVTAHTKPGDLHVTVGTQKVPVSRESLISSRDLLFQERAVVTNHLAPAREAGVMAEYTLHDGLKFTAGAFNGNGSILGDNNTGMLTAARIEYSHGDSYTTFTATHDNAWGVGIDASYNDDVATGTLRFGADALVRTGPIAVLAEGAYDRLTPTHTTVAPPTVVSNTDQYGALLQVSGYVPMFVGGLEIGARAEIFDDAIKLRDNGDVGILYGGATWRDPFPGVDVGLGYIHREELAGARIPNDTIRLWTQVRYPLWRPGTSFDGVMKPHHKGKKSPAPAAPASSGQ